MSELNTYKLFGYPYGTPEAIAAVKGYRYAEDEIAKLREELLQESGRVLRLEGRKEAVPDDYVMIAHLIGSIFCCGNFTAETHNERELEKLLRKVGRFYQSTDEIIAAAPTPGEKE